MVRVLMALCCLHGGVRVPHVSHCLRPWSDQNMLQERQSELMPARVRLRPASRRSYNDHHRRLELHTLPITRDSTICVIAITTLSLVNGTDLQGGAKKTGPPYLIANILKIPQPNCVEIGELLQYYMLNTVINFLFKNSIALWRHLAKTQVLCDAQIYLYNVNKRQ